MRHLVFSDNNEQGPFSIALLIKSTAFNVVEIENSYISTLVGKGISREEMIGFTLEYNEKGKAPSSLIKEYLANLLHALKQLNVKYLYCADAAYFKALTGARKAEPNLGYVLPCKWEGYEDMQVLLGINHKSLIYDPSNEPKMMLSLDTLANVVQDQHTELGSNIIKHAEYPETIEEIKAALTKLHAHKTLAVDIETFSLRFNEAGVATITFCWNQHEGIAFAVDYKELPERDSEGNYGVYEPNPQVHGLLKEFFESYQGETIFHNCTFDTKILIYELWMKDGLNMAGLLTGLHCLHSNIQDTKVIAYLATNSTAGNRLSLKDLAHEYAGNWAQSDIKDIRKIQKSELLQYNLIDGLSTWFVFDKYYPLMLSENQATIYQTLMMPSQKVITQIELSGMPVDQAQVAKAKQELTDIVTKYDAVYRNKPVINQLEKQLTDAAWKRDYETRKAKAKNPDKILPKDKNVFPKIVFNPASPKQVAELVYGLMKLPVIDLTETKQPATGEDTLKKVLNHCKVKTHKEIIEALIEQGKANKILSTFIPPMERAVLKPDGCTYLHGSFNLGGTVSGRLSSSDPNLQNLPSGSTYGKLIKKCFIAPKDWLFAGADFNSLEDYISALTTKDPNKLRVYLNGFDGHCLRAYAYFKDQMPDIRNIPENANQRCFTAKIGGSDIRFLSDDTITYNGNRYTGIEFYEKYAC